MTTTTATTAVNLNRRIKRHLLAPLHACFAVTPPGFESFSRMELTGLSDSVDQARTIRGGVLFRAKLTDIVNANLTLRGTNRVLMRIAHFTATNFLQLEKQSLKLPWRLFLPQNIMPDIKAAAHGSRLYHTDAVRDCLQKSIARYWASPSATAPASAGQTLFARLEDDRVTLSLDSSGAPLYQRGLKTHGAAAPLRETLAAGILWAAGYRPDRPLVDPMCGAGTFSLEAALIAKRIPPGLFRTFAFMQWPAFPADTYRHLVEKASRRVVNLPKPLIFASDTDSHACDNLRACLTANGLNDAVTVAQKDFFQIKKPPADAPAGLIVLNPPYGRRLNPNLDIRAFYNKIAATAATVFKGWRIGLVLPDRSLARVLPGRFNLLPFEHGGLNLWLLSGKIR